VGERTHNCSTNRSQDDSVGVTAVSLPRHTFKSLASRDLQDPNPEDPLNKEAATLFQENPRQFETLVHVSGQMVAFPV
jgi:hypothetical protein